jgi:hypothetical protein
MSSNACELGGLVPESVKASATAASRLGELPTVDCGDSVFLLGLQSNASWLRGSTVQARPRSG